MTPLLQSSMSHFHSLLLILLSPRHSAVILKYKCRLSKTVVCLNETDIYIRGGGAQSLMEIIGLFMQYNDNLYSFSKVVSKKNVRLRKKHRKLILGSQILQTDTRGFPIYCLWIVQCSALQCRGVQCSAWPSRVLQYSSLLNSAVHCCSLQFSAVQYSAMYCSAFWCSGVTSYYVTQYNLPF